MILKQNYTEKVLEFIHEKGVGSLNYQFLNSFSEFLAELFQVEYVLIDKYFLENPGIVETVALYSNNGIAPNITYELTDTPCENVINKKLCSYPSNIQKLFPKDEMLVNMKAESYIGIPLWSAKGEPIGLIAILGTKELQNVKSIETALQIVALKAAQVLEKVLFEAVFENQINQLKESEENYQHLFNENPISLWEEDFSYGYRKIQELLASGIKDIQKYYHENPEFFIECISNVIISNVNDASVKLFKAKDKEDLINNIHKIRTENALVQYEKIVVDILKGNKEVIYEVVFKNFLGDDVVGIVKVNLFHNKNKNELKAIISISDITDRVKSEKELLKSEEKFRNIVENTSEWIWATNEKGIFNYCNHMVEEITGFLPQELMGKSIYSFLSKSVTQSAKELIKKQVSKKIGWKNLIIKVRDKNGKKIILDSFANPIFCKNGNFIGFQGVNRDITFKENAISEMKKLSTVVEQSANSIIITDTEGTIEYVNKKFTDITGYTSDEAIGKNPRFLNSSTQPKEYFTNLWETVKGGAIWQGQFINKAKNGNLFWEETTITPIKNEQGKIVNFLAIKQDITELKKNELDLKESERKLLDAQNIAQIGTYFLDLKSKLFTSSYIFDKISGFKPKDTKTFDVWRTLIHPKDSKDNQKTLNSCIENGEKFDREYRIFTKGTKKLKWIHGLGEITYEEGEPISFSGTIQDITERKNAEIKIKEQNKILKIAKEKAEESDHLKTEFLNNMSHEIRTPMNGILGFTALLSNPDLSLERRKQYITIIQNSGNQLLQVIDDILEISRLETKQVTTQENKVNLNSLLFELFSIFNLKAKEQNIPLYFYKGLTDTQSNIITDEGKLLKILNNLLENAFKFTNIGHISLGYELKNNFIEIYVSDTGIGIAKEKQSSIFDRFAQEEKELSQKFGGLGLGLSIAKENSELLKGKIKLKSEKGIGSKFTVCIPYVPNYSNEDKTIIEKKINPVMKSILIAEDEEVNYLFLEMLLVDSFNLDYKILHAKNGIEAVEICKNNNTINLVLMDIKMPKMNGFEATILIKELNPTLTVVAQTAYSTPEDKEKAHNAGCNDFISKPITRKNLEPILTKYLNI
ncbi:PAS domain-containing hybrid sensor histidine kinase/response regulator [Lutibacter sp.]|uniref:PAS domain-containing hybrid sensor histidine kinase/response regulator n=1 Tax=Lutibacter sp. TaxID=1925666 RepID=UPI0027351EA1|nr:PAS domain S-box protein [Lutibacter sp.]MDP3313398.1 PAS domain S-box protein [Lutibacter sp.]